MHFSQIELRSIRLKNDLLTAKMEPECHHSWWAYVRFFKNKTKKPLCLPGCAIIFLNIVWRLPKDCLMTFLMFDWRLPDVYLTTFLKVACFQKVQSIFDISKKMCQICHLSMKCSFKISCSGDRFSTFLEMSKIDRTFWKKAISS